MASNSAPVGVGNRSSSFSQSNQKSPLGSPNRSIDSEFKREFPGTHELSDNTKRNGNETLYRIEVAVKQAQGNIFERQKFNKNSSGYLYGNYWQVSIPVYSLATFEAQQLIQMDLQGQPISAATSRNGNEAYITTKNILEQASVSANNDKSVVQEDQVHLSINIIT